VKEISTSMAGLLSGGGAASGGAVGLETANASLTACLSVAESSDRATPSQALALYAEAHAASQARIQQWAALKRGELEKLNEQLKSQGRAPIAIAAIEREVYYLMTR
jgi:hypothetical protein